MSKPFLQWKMQGFLHLDIRKLFPSQSKEPITKYAISFVPIIFTILQDIKFEMICP